MVVYPSSVVDNGHDIRVVVFIIVVERVEKDSETNPLVRTAKHLSFVISFVLGKPESLKKNPTTLKP